MPLTALADLVLHLPRSMAHGPGCLRAINEIGQAGTDFGVHPLQIGHRSYLEGIVETLRGEVGGLRPADLLRDLRSPMTAAAVKRHAVSG